MIISRMYPLLRGFLCLSKIQQHASVAMANSPPKRRSPSPVFQTSVPLPLQSAEATQPKQTIGRHIVCDCLLWVFRMFGVWHTAQTSRLYLAYAIVVQIGGTFIYTASLIAGFVLQSNLNERLHASGMMLELVALSLKLLNMCVYMREWQQVLSDCERFELRSHRDDGDVATVERTYVLERQRYYAFLAGSFWVMVNTAGTTLYVGSWLGHKVPFVAWYPGLDPRVGQPEFVWAYAYQVIGMVMMSNVNLVVELFACYVMLLMAVRLELIGRRIERLGWSPTDLRRLHVTDAEKRQCRRTMCECVRAHREVLRVVSLFERSYSKGIFAQISLSGTIMCLNAVLLTFVS